MQLPRIPPVKPVARPPQSPPREVRLIGGRWKRSKLPVADAPGLRPTPDRVRETLFNWLGQDLSGWRCLDAFAGSGALGFEAASRGAAEVVMIERDARLAASLRVVQQRLAADMLRIEVADALAWMARAPNGGFDLICLDPPFDAQLFEPALLAAVPLLSHQGFIYLEADRAFDDAALARFGLRVHRSGRAGTVHYHLLQHTPDGTPP